MNKKERAMDLFKSGYNCSQAVLGVFCEEAGLDFDTAMKISSSFGGGMGRMREVCGTVSGMFMAAGLLFGENINLNHEAKSQLYSKIQTLAKTFKESNGSIICKQLLQGVDDANFPIPSVRTDEYYKKRPCVELVGNAVEILENFINEQQNLIKN